MNISKKDQVFFLLILSLLIFFSCKAQNENTKNPFVQYESIQWNSDNHFYLVKFLPSLNYKHKLSDISIVKQLSKDCFIISSKKNRDSLQKFFSFISAANNNWKCSPSLLNESDNVINETTEKTFSLHVTDISLFKQSITQNKIEAIILNEYLPANILIINTSLKVLKEKILPLETIDFIDVQPTKAKEEQVLNGYDFSTSKINIVHSETPQLNGSGLTVSVKENRPDTADIDFKGRYLSTYLSSGQLSTHATIMTTIIGGAGNSFYSGMGVAYKSTLSSSGFASVLPDADSAYKLYKISVQNHSYGTEIQNFYGADAVAYDVNSNNNPSLIHVFSAGNSGNLSGTTGQYSGIKKFANLTGNFKMAKNIITVGSIDSFYNVSLLSSKGPAYDGRIKPELVAFGEEGSSGAAAIVSGISLILQQAYQKQNNNILPDASLLKAVLLNSADDVVRKGIDFISGYGSVNAYKAVNSINEKRFYVDSLQQGNTKMFTLPIPSNAINLKITLAWNDPAAMPDAFTALVNDLDLQLKDPHQKIFLPWVLNSSPNIDSLKQLPVRKRDSLNNTEQITIDNPVAGEYHININGFSVTGIQKFFISYQWDTINSFKWVYPTKTDNLFPGKQNLIRWQTTIFSKSKLECSYNGGLTWLLLNDKLDLSTPYYKWNVPDTFSIALLKLTVGNTVFISDTFSISQPLKTNVGFNCSDSVLFNWNKQKTETSYTVFSLSENYLQPLLITKDTFFIFYPSANTSFYYTVAGNLPFNKAAIKSYTFNYTTQGVGCYIKSFLANLLSDNTVNLNLILGTFYNVQSISFEKQTRTGWKTLQIFQPITNLICNGNDDSLTNGLNIYRAKIQLANGSVIYSDPQTIYNWLNNDYIIFPDPVHANQNMLILSKDPFNKIVSVYDITGRKVLEQNINNTLEQISVARLSKGFYIMVIVSKNKQVFKQKLIIL